MKHSEKIIKAIRIALLVGVVISVSSWAFAQRSGISGSVKDLSKNRGIGGVIITVKDSNIGTLAGTGTTDELGNYSVSIPSSGNYTLIASKPGYITLSAPDVMEISPMIPNRTVNISMGNKELLQEKPEENAQTQSWGTGDHKSYLVPALEIPAFLFLLNRYDRYAYPDEMSNGKKTYNTNWTTFRNHIVHGGWGIDSDAFNINQFAHPYQGSIYHGIARSSGLNYWEALLYDNAGSFLWETGGENTHPSYNDQIASGIGGSFFGEALFRLSGLVLEGDGSKPGFWRELGAAAICPSMGFNRLAYGDRFRPVFPSNDPATFWRLRLGASTNFHVTEQSVTDTITKTEFTGDFTFAYGLPGQPGYRYTRPFDYFHLEATTLGNADNPVENIMIRGLLLGKDYEIGNSYCGIWGLYGGYDYMSPHIFRISSTSASLGTTYQWWLSRMVALQGSALGGVGYAAAGNETQPEVNVDNPQYDARDYHFGIAPQGLLALRLILANRAMFDLTGRAYYVSGMGSDDPGGNETIERLNMGFTVRVYKYHALGVQYIASIRDAQFSNRPDTHQRAASIGLVYTYLGDAKFGAVEWAKR